METPLHPTPMQRPMMKGKIYVDASNKPTFQGIWGMTHADVTKGGQTNDFKVVRMEAVRPDELGMPVFAGHYLGYFKLTSNHQTETINESFTLQFRGHSNQGYNVYGYGENRFGKNEIVGTVTQTGKMEIFKMIVGTTNQPDPDEAVPPLPKPMSARTVSPPPLATGTPFPAISGGATPAISGGATPRVGGAKSKSGKSSGGASKRKSSKSSKSSKNSHSPPSSVNGLPGTVVKCLKECVIMLKKADKLKFFHAPVLQNFMGHKGLYADVIKKPMDFGTVLIQIDTKYRTAAECIEDLRLVFSNAKLFNSDTDLVHATAASLSGKFEAYVSVHSATLGLDSPKSSPISRGKGTAGGSAKEKGPKRDADAAAPPTSAAGGGGGRGVNGGTAAVKAFPSPAEAPAPAPAPAAAPTPAPLRLTVDQQDQLATDFNQVFQIGNANPTNKRAQARVYALWSFAKAYVADKDRVPVNGGKASEVQMDALTHKRQRQLREIVTFFLNDGKNDPEPEEDAPEDAAGEERDAESKVEDGEDQSDMGEVGETDFSPSERRRKRSRSDFSDSDDEDDVDGDSPKRARSDSENASESKNTSLLEDSVVGDDDRVIGMDIAEDRSNESGLIRLDSSRLTLEATAASLKDVEIDLDLEEDDEDDDLNGGSGGDGAGDADEEIDEQWSQARREKREKEERERIRAAEEKALEEERLRHQAQRERERVEEGLKLCRERAAEKARKEAAALEKQTREKELLEAKKEAERLAREEQKESVDLDQVRGNRTLMSLMDASVYED